MMYLIENKVLTRNLTAGKQFGFAAAFLALMLPLRAWRGAVLQAQSETGGILNTLRRDHPRIYATAADFSRIKALVGREPEAKQWYDELETQSQKMLAEPPAEYKLIGPRLLSQSRAALYRISTLAFLYRLDGDQQKAARARAELLAISAFPDWHPPHFLDTAELTHAAALGYDWLYDYLSPEDRAIVRGAIVEKGLKPGLEAFRQKAWWTKSEYNWNQVCNGGLTLGALAIAQEEPELARQILALSRASVGTAMRSFAPDGGWGEGPGYWNYATQYNVYYLAALESALGTDFGFKATPGFADTGFFHIHSIGPLGLTFNFADADAKAGTAPQMFWLAREFSKPDYAWQERQAALRRPSIFHLLWWTGKPQGGAPLGELPLDAIFRAVNVAYFRSAWGDPAAFYVGFKGGDNRTNHSHLDLGTFVLDARGERWALDLGPDDYDLPGYFGKERWTYYRLRTEGHNTLTIDDENQNPEGKAPLVAFLSTPDLALAVADLTSGYTPKVERAWRGIALLNRGEVLVEDEVDSPKSVAVVWNFHTQAEVRARGKRALLSFGNVQLEARILRPDDARFRIIPADPPPPQAQQPGVHNLTVRLPDKTRHARLAVLLAPPGAPIPDVEPLKEWIAEGKLKQ